MDYKVISETPITASELASELKSIEKRDSELNFRATKTQEYLTTLTKLSKPKAAELAKELEALEIPRIKDIQIIKIIDLLPKNMTELKVVLQGYPITVSEANMKKILDVVKQYI